MDIGVIVGTELNSDVTSVSSLAAAAISCRSATSSASVTPQLASLSSVSATSATELGGFRERARRLDEVFIRTRDDGAFDTIRAERHSRLRLCVVFHRGAESINRSFREFVRYSVSADLLCGVI
jgi:hypothetical protein